VDGALWQIPASGGEATRATTLDTARDETVHSWPAFLPDGRRFVFSIAAARPEHAGIYLGSLDGREPRKLLPLQSSLAYASGYLLYRREQTLVAHPFDASIGDFRGEPVLLADAVDLSASFTARGAFAVSGNGVLVYREPSVEDGELAWFDRARRHLGTIGPVNDALPKLSPDGARLVVVRDGSRNRAPADVRTAPGASTPMDVWMVDLRRSLSSRFTFDEQANETDAVWSPDGASIVYVAHRHGGSFTLMRKAASGGAAEETLLQLKTMMFPRDVSPDGRYVLVAVPGSEKQRTGGDLAVVRLAGERTLTRITDTPFSEWWGRFSPDGRWVAYDSDESGSSEVYVQPFPADGRKWRISHTGGGHPVWRSDSRELFYLTRNTVMAADMTTAAGTLIPSTPRKLFDTQFSSGPAVGRTTSPATASGS
jgi:eukaryotic-like serine/threonine-protein kinase